MKIVLKKAVLDTWYNIFSHFLKRIITSAGAEHISSKYVWSWYFKKQSRLWFWKSPLHLQKVCLTCPNTLQTSTEHIMDHWFMEVMSRRIFDAADCGQIEYTGQLYESVWLLFQSIDVVSEYVVYPNLQHNLRLLGGYNMSCYATRKIILLQAAKAKQHSNFFWRCRLDMSCFAMRKIIFYDISLSHARGRDVTWVKRLLICAKKNVKTKICTSHVDFVI